MLKRPEVNEYNPFYSNYVHLVPEGDLLHILNEQSKDTVHLLHDLSESQAEFRYGPDKWSIKEVVGHVTDTECIMGYRLLSIARGETISLPGYDENAYVQNASFNKQTLTELLEHFVAVRHSTIQLLKGLATEDFTNQGSANHSDVTVRALAYIIAGHELHHRKIIKERYMESDAFPSL